MNRVNSRNDLSHDDDSTKDIVVVDIIVIIIIIVPVEEIENEWASERRLIAALVDGDVVRRLGLGIESQNNLTERLRQPPAHPVPHTEPEMIRPTLSTHTHYAHTIR